MIAGQDLHVEEALMRSKIIRALCTTSQVALLLHVQDWFSSTTPNWIQGADWLPKVTVPGSTNVDIAGAGGYDDMSGESSATTFSMVGSLTRAVRARGLQLSGYRSLQSPAGLSRHGREKSDIPSFSGR